MKKKVIVKVKKKVKDEEGGKIRKRWKSDYVQWSGEEKELEEVVIKFTQMKERKEDVQVLNSSAIASGYAGRDPQGGFCDRSVTVLYWNR